MLKTVWLTFLAWLKPQPLGNSFHAKIVNVVDADSLEIQVGWHRYPVRLVGVDGPEYLQEFGVEGFQYLVKLAYSNNCVTVENFGFDKYGRILARIMVGDIDLAHGLLLAGLAWHLPAFSKKSIPEHVARYRHAVHQARQERRGLWAHANPVHPAQFRAARLGPKPGRSSPANNRQQDLFT